jgi:hypothetical protein
MCRRMDTEPVHCERTCVSSLLSGDSRQTGRPGIAFALRAKPCDGRSFCRVRILPAEKTAADAAVDTMKDVPPNRTSPPPCQVCHRQVSPRCRKPKWPEYCENADRTGKCTDVYILVNGAATRLLPEVRSDRTHQLTVMPERWVSPCCPCCLPCCLPKRFNFARGQRSAANEFAQTIWQ